MSLKTWDKLVRYVGLVSGVFSIISFAFPKIPDSVRYISLAIAGGSSAYYVFQMYVPLNVYARAYRANAEAYGLKYEVLDIRAVMGEDGSASVNRTMKLVSTSPELREVEHYLMVPGCEEEAEELPSLDVSQVSWEDQRYALTVEKTSATPSRLNFIVKISPPLSKHRSIEYTIKETAPPGILALTTDQLLDGVEHEFFAWQVSRPTKELHLEIKIPVSVGTQRQVFDVWPATEFGHFRFSRATPEFDRVNDSGGWKREIETIQGKDYVRCELTVQHPILGLRYVIKWIPWEG